MNMRISTSQNFNLLIESGEKINNKERVTLNPSKAQGGGSVLKIGGVFGGIKELGKTGSSLGLRQTLINNAVKKGVDDYQIALKPFESIRTAHAESLKSGSLPTKREDVKKNCQLEIAQLRIMQREIKSAKLAVEHFEPGSEQNENLETLLQKYNNEINLRTAMLDFYEPQDTINIKAFSEELEEVAKQPGYDSISAVRMGLEKLSGLDVPVGKIIEKGNYEELNEAISIYTQKVKPLIKEEIKEEKEKQIRAGVETEIKEKYVEEIKNNLKEEIKEKLKKDIKDNNREYLKYNYEKTFKIAKKQIPEPALKTFMLNVDIELEKPEFTERLEIEMKTEENEKKIENTLETLEFRKKFDNAMTEKLKTEMKTEGFKKKLEDGLKTLTTPEFEIELEEMVDEKLAKTPIISKFRNKLEKTQSDLEAPFTVQETSQ